MNRLAGVDLLDRADDCAALILHQRVSPLQHGEGRQRLQLAAQVHELRAARGYRNLCRAIEPALRSRGLMANFGQSAIQGMFEARPAR